MKHLLGSAAHRIEGLGPRAELESCSEAEDASRPAQGVLCSVALSALLCVAIWQVVHAIF
jgi:hypothetical protein